MFNHQPYFHTGINTCTFIKIEQCYKCLKQHGTVKLLILNTCNETVQFRTRCRIMRCDLCLARTKCSDTKAKHGTVKAFLFRF